MPLLYNLFWIPILEFYFYYTIFYVYLQILCLFLATSNLGLLLVCLIFHIHMLVLLANMLCMVDELGRRMTVLLMSLGRSFHLPLLLCLGSLACHMVLGLLYYLLLSLLGCLGRILFVFLLLQILLFGLYRLLVLLVLDILYSLDFLKFSLLELLFLVYLQDRKSVV